MSQRDMPIKATPYQHQVNAFDFSCHLFGSGSRGAALLMEMGTGKTLTAIAVMGALYRAREARKVLVVCPLSITGVWLEELGKFAAFDYSAAILEGTMAKKTTQLQRLYGHALQVAIVNYESAWRMESELFDWDADIIVCDEGHKLKTHNTKQSKTLHTLGRRTRYRMLLTGTLITNKALDVFSQYKFLSPSIFGQSFYSFRSRYFDMVGYGNHTPVMKRTLEPELTEKIHSVAFRVTKAECLDLPETTDITRYVDLEQAAARVYQDLVKDSFAELSKGEVTVTNILTRLLRLSQLTGGYIGSDDGGAPQRISRAKLDALDDIVEDVLNEDRKLVIIARFIPEIAAIRKMMDGKKVKYSLIMGGVKDRAEQVTAFQNDPDVKVFIGQIATAGLGITLTAASTMVFYSLDYSMSNYEQTRARIHRSGQKNHCTYIHLTARSTVDEKVLEALAGKADLARSLVDDYRKGLNPYEKR